MLDFTTKPLIAMLHLKGSSQNDMLERVKREAEIYFSCGLDAVLVENYFGSERDCIKALEYIAKSYPDKPYGVNILGNIPLAFELAEYYKADFLQIDSVCGHLSPAEDRLFGEKLASLRQNTDCQILGGLRFKYQPVLSGRSLEEDAEIAKGRCDAVVTTGEATAADCPTEKLHRLKGILGRFPLITGAGVTASTVAEKLIFSDGVIVGSWLKDFHKAEGEVNEEYVRQLVNNADRVRFRPHP